MEERKPQAREGHLLSPNQGPRRTKHFSTPHFRTENGNSRKKQTSPNLNPTCLSASGASFCPRGLGMWPAGAAPDIGTASILWLSPTAPNRVTPMQLPDEGEVISEPQGAGGILEREQGLQILGAGHAARVSSEVPGLPAAGPFPGATRCWGLGPPYPGGAGPCRRGRCWTAS